MNGRITLTDRRAFATAIQNGEIQVVSEMIARIQKPELVNTLNTGSDVDRCQTPLILAIESGQDLMALFLLTYGVDLYKTSAYYSDSMALHMATIKNYQRVVQQIIKLAPNLINIKDGLECTALMLATRFGHKEIVRFLLSSGADPNICSISNWTPLMYCYSHNDAEIALMLLKAGCNVDIINDSGRMALCIMNMVGNQVVADAIVHYTSN